MQPDVAAPQLAPVLSQLTLLFGPRVAAGIVAVTAIVLFIAHGVMPWAPVASATSPAWYRGVYLILRFCAGNYANAQPRPPGS